MKKSRGISVLALVITVIVIIIITSITVYTGVNMIADARKKSAEDKLATICNALRRDDIFMELENGSKTLTQTDFDSLDLSSYYDDEQTIILIKETDSTDNQTVYKYTLNMYRGKDLANIYASQSFIVVDKLEKNSYTVSFDEVNGVNRPIISDNMYALSLDGSTIVDDIYTTNWYDYQSKATTFAKMKYDSDKDGEIDDESITYVWIPRFAYSIQQFYDCSTVLTRSYVDVPTSALRIVFLRENSNYMSNNEVIATGYRVHPAFRANGKELPGIWVASKPSATPTTFTNAAYNCSYAVRNDDYISSHLMTNSEFAAALYLMFYLNDYEEIDFTSRNEYVAAGLNTSSAIKSLEYVDLYATDNDRSTKITLKVGDAVAETNWDRTIANYPTNDKPIFVRQLRTGYFDFDSASESSSSYYYRPVIINK